MDRMTFDAICRRCQDINLQSEKKLDKTIPTELWDLICKFDYHSTEENSLLIKLMTQTYDVAQHQFIEGAFTRAVAKNCPNVVAFLLTSKQSATARNRIISADIDKHNRFSCWSSLQNAQTADLLQQNGFIVNEHPTLLDHVVFKDRAFYPRPSGFTRFDHVKAILGAEVNRSFVEAVVEKLKAKETNEKADLLFILNNYLASKK